MNNHIQTALNTDQARQTLGATTAGQDPKLDLRQTDASLRLCNSVVSAKRKLQPTAKTNTHDCCYDRLCRILHELNQGRETRLSHRQWPTELCNVCAPRERSIIA